MPGCHVAGKEGAANWNEGYPNPYFVGVAAEHLHRLVRQTKGYTASAWLLIYSAAWLLADWASKSNISLLRIPRRRDR